ncbi:hypothetical protein LO772_22510 [Yinghuangia sp. ASG 101]|uniref:hypothetical protein n=1 Tax=Yinghuangia sp. ASG 101 TaxID=2896848 RepID=UPI001E5E95C4|nr:hypothetical protein [Yinghuangia sp. ASG 101]UGQ09678.1 hypothetical protein LO772_22510 [Yinghuangia sp. ASG 101]
MAGSAHHAHASLMAFLPMGADPNDDPLKPKVTKMPRGMAGPINAALGIAILLFIIVSVFMLLRALFDAVTAYKDGAAVPFGSIIMIVVFLAIAVGGVTSLVFLVVPNGWLA